jgi:hypothetical protein
VEHVCTHIRQLALVECDHLSVLTNIQIYLYRRSDLCMQIIYICMCMYYIYIYTSTQAHKESSIISGTSAAVRSKITLGLLATIALEVDPTHAYAPFPALLPSLNASWKSCSVRVFSIACDSASVTSLVSKWRPFSLIFSWGSGDWVGEDSHVLFWANIPLMKNEVWDGALSWCNSQFFRLQISGRSICTFSRSHRKTSQQYAQLTVWPASTNSLWTIPLMSKKMMSMRFTLFSTCLTFFGLGKFGFFVYGSCFLLRTPV